MAKGRPPAKPFLKGNPGRPKGSKNKFTTLKAAFIGAFQDIGGQDTLAKFAKTRKGQRAFYLMISKMLPSDVHVAGIPDSAIVKYEGLTPDQLVEKARELIGKK